MRTAENAVRIITRKRLEEFARRHPRARRALQAWADVVEDAQWANLAEVRQAYPHADGVRVGSGRIATVFNICGNDFRLVTAIHYDMQRVFTMRFLTHAEYSKEAWKETL